MDLRDYQSAAVDHACEWAATARVGDVQLYAAPTGVGKSLMELAIQARTGFFIITPRLEIARGFLEKSGIFPDTLQELIDESQKLNIYTPIRFRNLLFKGKIPHVPGLIVDEGHHQLATSYRDDWLASGMPPMMLFTATPFRGSSRATVKFREDFGEPLWIITLPQAVARGDVAMPTPEILPLVDDDVVNLNAAGEFDVTALESATLDRIADIARIAEQRWLSGGKWDRTTVFCLPTVNTAKRLGAILPSSIVITAATPNIVRRAAFEGLRQRTLAIIQVSVMGEGVDLPVRRLIDLAPVMSPVKWMQVFGRATRPTPPGEAAPEYVCTNRNLLRHAYLLEGLCPPAALAAASEVFGPSERTGIRAFGLENLGRFKPVHLKLTSGATASLYMLVDTSGGRLTEFACLHHPARPDLIWAHRIHTGSGDSRVWGTWQQTDTPRELKGFASQPPRTPTEKQIAWWERSAASYGLDPDVKLTRKNFAALPLLKDLGVRL